MNSQSLRQSLKHILNKGRGRKCSLYLVGQSTYAILVNLQRENYSAIVLHKNKTRFRKDILS